ncbi:MAG: hypothetical protein R6X13_00465, partial [bacterium]
GSWPLTFGFSSPDSSLQRAPALVFSFVIRVSGLPSLSLSLPYSAALTLGFWPLAFDLFPPCSSPPFASASVSSLVIRVSGFSSVYSASL